MSMPLAKLQTLDDEPGLFEERPAIRPASRTASTIAVRKVEKSSTAHRTISEVAEELDVPQHVLRFWETKFTQLRPLKRGGGRRYYRTEDVALIRQIHGLLYAQGYTIKGAQNVLKAKPARPVQEVVEKPMVQKAAPAPAKLPVESREILVAMLAELKALRALV